MEDRGADEPGTFGQLMILHGVGRQQRCGAVTFPLFLAQGSAQKLHCHSFRGVKLVWHRCSTQRAPRQSVVSIAL
jgi:hypothetical protein